MAKLNQEEVLHKLERKGDFTVYLKVYGKNRKLLCELFDEFTAEETCLTRKDLSQIEIFLLNHACIDERHIDHTVMSIKQFSKKEFIGRT